MHLTKSDFILARNCPTKLFYKKQKYPTSSADNELMEFLENGAYMIETMARLLHPGGQQMFQGGDPEQAFEATCEALTGGNITLFEATVLHGHLLAQVDILQREGHVLNLIEVKSTSIDGVLPGESPFRGKRGGIESRWRKHLEAVCFQAYILARAFPTLTIVPYLNFGFARSLMESLSPNGTTYIWSKFERAVLRRILQQHDTYRHEDPERRGWLVWITQDDAFVDMLELANEILAFLPGADPQCRSN